MGRCVPSLCPPTPVSPPPVQEQAALNTTVDVSQSAGILWGLLPDEFSASPDYQTLFGPTVSGQGCPLSRVGVAL